MLALNNQLAGDAYSQFTTREQPGTVRTNLYVYNAAVYYSYMDEDRVWSEDIYATPGDRSLDRKVRGIRVRNAVAGKAARFTLELLTRRDVAA